MSDLRSFEDSTAATADAIDAPVATDGSEGRDGLRVDPPHHFGVDPSAATSGTLPPPPERHQSRYSAEQFDESNADYDVVHEPASDSLGSKGSASRFPYGDPLLQARQIAEHLQKRYSELEHRERRLATQLTLLDQERRSVRMWVSECEAVLLERDVELVDREQSAEKREATCLNLEHELQSRKAELLVREKEMDEIQARWRAEWERERAELQKELDLKRIDLQNEQVHFAQTKETQLAEIQQERGLLLNRIRFQEEHLQKLRHDFEGIQNAFHSEKQRIQSHLSEMELQHSRRQAQMTRFRQILEERDVAIQRQHVLLAKARKAGVDSLMHDHQRIVAEGKDWQLVRNKQQQDMVKQHEMLRLNAENLEGRQQRLEKLRLELEETNRRTLEMRLVVEEACAQLAQAVGPESAKQRIEAAQFALSDHYRYAREQISGQRQELEQFMAAIAKQRDELRSEQQTLAEWVSKRDEELRLREANVRQEQAAATAREQAWQNTREHWMLEKLEAEAIIRDLLKRLEGETEATITG